MESLFDLQIRLANREREFDSERLGSHTVMATLLAFGFAVFFIVAVKVFPSVF